MGFNMHVNAMQSLRAATLLIPLTGNLDVKGGNLLPVSDFPLITARQMDTRLSREEMAKAPGVKERPMYYGYDAAFFPAQSYPPAFFDMLLTGNPYKIRVLFSFCDPVMGEQDSQKTADAIKNVDFIVSSDFFISPTANLADIVLPPATFLEREWLHYFFYKGFFCVSEKAIEPVGECRDDKEIFIELAKRLNLELPLPIKSVRDFINYQLKPSGMTFDDLKGKGVTRLKTPFQYKKYERKGFRFPTETGKIELYSKLWEKHGYDPLPYYEEPPQSPYSTPELSEQYPFIFISGARTGVYYHGTMRQVPWLREMYPEPKVEIHPDTAEKLGIRNGDWVWIETPQKEGRVKQKAELTLGIHPKVVHARSHWWFPERTDDPDRGCMESNINVILSMKGPYDPISGSTLVRGGLCKIYKVEGQ